MIYNRKLKPEKSIVGFVPAFASLIIFAISALIIGPVRAMKVLGVIMFIYAAITLAFYYSRTRSTTYLISGAYLIVFGCTLWSMQLQYHGHPEKVFPPIARFFGIWMIVLWFWLLYLMATRKVKWKGTEILELAAQGVDPSEDTYTERPLPVGKVEASRDEVLSFAAFLRKNQICMSYKDDDKVYLVPITMKDSMYLVVHPEFNVIEKTWISFNYSGEVTVHISKQSYLAYRDNLTFDHLCNSMGELFIEFFEWYKKGEGVRIIDKLDKLKLNIMT
jgi:hypothetical protein